MKMKFRAHDTFYIRKGWLSKGMKYVAEKPNVFVDKNENPMDVLGIGANMVKALRYWLQAVGLTEEPTTGVRNQTFTSFGNIVYKYDKYMEELGTLYLLQYKLVTNQENATAWYFFFNEFSIREFTREDFIQQLQNFIRIKKEDNLTVAINSLHDDFACILKTYIPRYKLDSNKVDPENNIDCPFGELGLIDILDKRTKIYKKSIPSVQLLNPWVVLAVIMDQAKDRKEVGLNELLTYPKNIGKVFNLDAIAMLEILHSIEKLGKIKIIRTAGLDIIQIQEFIDFDKCVLEYYQSIN